MLMMTMLVMSHETKAQVSINANINIGQQPLWGPVGHRYVDYYYMPDIDVYYDVPQARFVYFDGGRWLFAASLPSRYGNYNLYGGYKVVINERDPWLRDDVYKVKYKKYKGWQKKQLVIRDSYRNRYYEREDHPRHNEWKGNKHDDDRKPGKRKGNKHDND